MRKKVAKPPNRCYWGTNRRKKPVLRYESKKTEIIKKIQHLFTFSGRTKGLGDKQEPIVIKLS